MNYAYQKGVEPSTTSLVKSLEESGIPYKIIEFRENPIVSRAVSRFIQKIEQAHRNAENSKLVFKAVC
jgi:arsenate reductase-like glutaredoxin family protein